MHATVELPLRRWLVLVGGLCLVVVLGGGGGEPLYAQEPAAPSDSATADDGRAVVEADSLSALTRSGERLQELFGNVKVRQDSTRLRSAFALRYLDRDELLFTGDVVIYERGDTLRADTVRYNKRTKVGHARSNVRLTDGEVRVRAPRATYYTDEKRSVFPDSVTLIDSTRVLRAETGTYWSDARRAEFQGNVHLTDPETHLASDSLTYYRDRERSIARGTVSIRRMGREEEAPNDTTTRTYLFGQWADNQEQNRFSRVEGQALLVRVRLDATGTPEDTLAVRGRRLDAYRTDTRRRLIALDSVRIWEADLAAVADSTVYDRLVAVDTTDTLATPSAVPPTTAPQRPAAAPAPSSPDPGQAAAAPPQQAAGPDSTATPDTSRETDAAAPRSADRWTGPPSPREADLPVEETRLFRDPVVWFENAQVWGDSIRVRARRRTLDTVFVRGHAFAAQRDNALDRVQQLKGRTLTAFFRADSLRRIEAEPNAQAIRFLKTDAGALKGAAKTSGDRIVLRFRDGAVRRTSVIGGVESTYHRTPEAVPTPFHLEGFQWTPERRPTKEALLREERVRAQLGLSANRPPPIPRSPYTSAPADPAATGEDSTAVPPAPPNASPPDSLQSSTVSP